MQISRQLINLLLRLRKLIGPSATEGSLKLTRRAIDTIGMLLKPSEGVNCIPVALGQIPAEFIQEKSDSKKGNHKQRIEAGSIKKDAVILYLHGGAYVAGSISSHRQLVSKLVVASHIDAYIINYRLAPESQYPAALDDVHKTFDALLDMGYEANQIALVGDCAGGGLAMAFMMRLKALKREMPGCAALMSPWLDLTCSNPSYLANRGLDYVLSRQSLETCAAMYVGNIDRERPFVSPIFGDMAGLPPILIHVGSEEILSDDALELANKLEKANVEHVYKVWLNMQHVFQVQSPILLEGLRSIAEIGHFINNQMSKQQVQKVAS